MFRVMSPSHFLQDSVFCLLVDLLTCMLLRVAAELCDTLSVRFCWSFLSQHNCKSGSYAEGLGDGPIVETSNARAVLSNQRVIPNESAELPKVGRC